MKSNIEKVKMLEFVDLTLNVLFISMALIQTLSGDSMQIKKQNLC